MGTALLTLSLLLFKTGYTHKLMVDWIYEEGKVWIDAFFPDGRPARNVKVKVLRPDGSELRSGRTDEEGRFSFDPGDGRRFKVIVQGSMGHRAKAEVTLGEETRVSHQLPYKVKIPWREVFSGLGYIFGGAGIILYLLSRRRRAS
ncbi:MAG TPA: carboxypeptidase regulatory-like domain-containing protein [Candidatus Latescibacteria bacterium]|nr:carboxypeptidase regulatory-like domain-containing protein [Candidatus Latescibacterota bacterium]